MKLTRTASYLTVGALVFSGCSSVTPPREELATAELAVREAQQSKASQHASLELRMATEKLNRAKQAMRDEDHVAARRLAEQALVDAQLAENKARSAEARAMARQLREGIETLRKEAERVSG
ncbi:MAG TPA: DUF4398 domain-containing protein [Candidatus Binatia bacterium]